MLVLVRGLPGSGKSTFARKLEYFEHVEADMFFVTKDGQYIYNPDLIKDAHNWCQETTFKALADGWDVVVSNTFSRIWEMEPYFKMAKTFGMQLTVIKMEGNFETIHNVSADAIQRMRERWEDYVGEKN